MVLWRLTVAVLGVWGLLAVLGCTADVSGPNRAPVAVAGSDRAAEPEQRLLLDGAGSYDPDGDALAFRWTLLSAPAGAGAGLEIGQTAGLQPSQAALTPDRPGTWLVALTVSDGRLDSARDVLRLAVGGRPCQQDADCDDGLWCNGQERCVEGRCRPGEPVDCSHAGDACNPGVCDEQTDACTTEPAAAGTACDDGLFCTVDDQCDGAGNCSGQPRDCPAGSACQRAECDEQAGACTLVALADGSPCDDGLYCNVGETCQAGVCSGGGPLDCSAAGGGCSDGVCDEEQDDCIGVDLPDGTACDDGDPCTVGDACAAGDCLGDTKDCSALDDACNQGRCDPLDGSCYPEPANEGQPCDDGLACTLGDRCVAGACQPTGLVDCSALDDACLAGVCQEPDGQCVTQPADEGQPCDDDLFCTADDACDQGECRGSPRACPDPADPCQLPVCDEDADQCDQEPAEDGTPCDDQSNCTGGDACQAGVCQGSDLCRLGCNQAQNRCYQLDPSNAAPERLCVAGADDIQLSGGQEVVLDTDGGTLDGQPLSAFQTAGQGAGLPELAVISFDTITVAAGAALWIRGNRAPVLLACGDVQIDGTIDVSAENREPGPGGYGGGAGGYRDEGDAIAAEDGAAPPDSGAGGGGGSTEDDSPYREAGGGGGGHGQPGGAGGAATSGDGAHAGGSAGAVCGAAELVPLHGGAGGGGAGSYNTGGDGGGGGGALQLSAGGTLTIGASAVLRAAGDGGGVSSTSNYGGGGGGGAGGTILLEAVEVIVHGTLAANGGGGGGGRTDYHPWGRYCPDNTPTAGGLGPAGTARASGGTECDASSGAPDAGGGGRGGSRAGMPAHGETGFDGRASGGGGGGVGRIRFNSHQDAALTVDGTTSPSCDDLAPEETTCSHGAIDLH